jgi:hypothetical protein
MPTWIHGFAGNQPVTPVIETLRGLLLGLPMGTSPAQGGRLVPRHPGRLGGRLRGAVPPPHGLTAGRPARLSRSWPTSRSTPSACR